MSSDIIDKMRSLKDNDGWKFLVDDMLNKINNLKEKISKYHVNGEKNLSIDDVRYIQGRLWEISEIIDYPQDKINKLISKPKDREVQ